MKAKSTAPKMPQTTEFIPLNSRNGIHLTRSWVASVDLIRHSSKMTGLDPWNLGRNDSLKLKLFSRLLHPSTAQLSSQHQPGFTPQGLDLFSALNSQLRWLRLLQPGRGISRSVDPNTLHALQRADPTDSEIPRGPIILNSLIKWVKSVPPHIKNFTVRNANSARYSPWNGLIQEGQIHPNDSRDRTTKSPTGLFSQLAINKAGLYPHVLDQLNPKKRLSKINFTGLTLAFWGKNDLMVSGIDTSGLKPFFNLFRS